MIFSLITILLLNKTKTILFIYFRQIYKEPTPDKDGNAELIENAKQVLHPDVSPLLVSDEKLAKLPPTYVHKDSSEIM
jgi:hypothetical protein